MANQSEEAKQKIEQVNKFEAEARIAAAINATVDARRRVFSPSRRVSYSAIDRRIRQSESTSSLV